MRVLATVPAERRVLITAHDAFNYFGRRYDFEVQGIQGISTESEAGLRRVEQLVDLLVERQIPAVFVETTIPARGVQALIAGAAARGHEVAIGGALFSDAMGPPGSYEGTYVGMIDHNVTHDRPGARRHAARWRAQRPPRDGERMRPPRWPC